MNLRDRKFYLALQKLSDNELRCFELWLYFSPNLPRALWFRRASILNSVICGLVVALGSCLNRFYVVNMFVAVVFVILGLSGVLVTNLIVLRWRRLGKVCKVDRNAIKNDLSLAYAGVSLCVVGYLFLTVAFASIHFGDGKLSVAISLFTAWWIVATSLIGLHGLLMIFLRLNVATLKPLMVGG